MDTLLAWTKEHPAWIWGSMILSVALFAAAVLFAPRMVSRLPADFLVDERRREPWPSSISGVVVWSLRNLVGLALLMAGVLMLVLPGQGVLSIVAALFLMTFPGKLRLKRWVLRQRSVLRAVNALRGRHGAPPLQDPVDREDAGPGGEIPPR